jgi:hypothetical protein
MGGGPLSAVHPQLLVATLTESFCGVGNPLGLGEVGQRPASGWPASRPGSPYNHTTRHRWLCDCLPRYAGR